MQPINRYMDAAVLVPAYTQDQSRAAIEKTVELSAKTACVRPCDITLAKQICAGSDTGVCVVLGFPHGVQLTCSKADEAKRYCDLGVDEIDMVSNYGMARSGMWDAVRDDIAAVVQASSVPVKVIFETSQLETPTVERMVEICIEAEAAFVKTSTGFNGEGATQEMVATMLRVAAGRIQVKPSGGIRDRDRAEMFVAMGATRLGVGWSSCQTICDNTFPANGSDY